MPDPETVTTYYRIGADRLADQNADDVDLSRKAFNLVNLGFGVLAAGVFTLQRATQTVWDDVLPGAVLALLMFVGILAVGLTIMRTRSWSAPPTLRQVDKLMIADPEFASSWLVRYFTNAVAENQALLKVKERALFWMVTLLACETGGTIVVIVATIRAALETQPTPV